MFCRLIILALAALTIAAAAPKTDDVPKQALEVVVVNDISEITKKYPGSNFQLLNKEVNKSGDQAARYTLGKRVRDDSLVAEGSDAYTFPEKKDVAMQLKYGYDGDGATVTFVEINCEQDGDGKAYVVDGGIGQRFITVVIMAYETKNYAIRAEVYGVN